MRLRLFLAMGPAPHSRVASASARPLRASGRNGLLGKTGKAGQGVMAKNGRQLRSQAWFGGNDRDSMMHRSWMKNEGMPADSFDGRPVIGICNTWSELTPCNAHFRQIAERVKRGVLEAGGFPLEFPVMSLGESNLRPTAMLFRNLVSMDVEESIRGNPIDGVILLVGCDKTTPALLMGAASCDIPAIAVSGGPMLNGQFRGQEIGSGTDIWRFSEDVKAGRMSLSDFLDSEAAMPRSRRSIPAAWCSPSLPAGGSSTWSMRTSSCRRS